MVGSVAVVHRLSVDDVVRMVQAGVLDERDRVELLDGVLVDMNPIGPRHEDVVGRLLRHFARPDAPWWVRANATLLIARGFVLPDLLVLASPPCGEHPSSALLVAEVAETSHRRDEEKRADYARLAVPEYWIVDLPARRLVVHRDPQGDGYASVEPFRDGDRVQPLLDVPPVAVTGLFDE